MHAHEEKDEEDQEEGQEVAMATKKRTKKKRAKSAGYATAAARHGVSVAKYKKYVEARAILAAEMLG
jgi:hypothetical protein